MAGFQGYRVVEPPTSKAVQRQLHSVIENNSRCLSVTLELERQTDVIPLRSGSIVILFILARAR